MKDRIEQFPHRYTLTNINTSEVLGTFDLAKAGGVVTEEGTPINKGSLLKDSTAGLYGLTDTAVPDDIFKKVVPKQLLQSYITAGTYTWTAPDRNGDGSDYEIFVIVVGGGGSGAALKSWYNSAGLQGQVAGGGSGFSKQFKLTVTPESTYTIVVGAGGLSVSVGAGDTQTYSAGNNGNSSSFNGIVANGGFGGGAYPNYSSIIIQSAKGGRPSDMPYSVQFAGAKPAIGDMVNPYSDANIPNTAFFAPSDCINQITKEVLLAAGGSIIFSGLQTYDTIIAQNESVTVNGLIVGSAYKSLNYVANVSAVTPTLPGSGGGACVNAGNNAENTTITSTSGKGADGCALIYA